MNVAMLAGGQPRFTKYWMENYKRLVGATKIDLYFYLWDDYLLTDSQLNFSDKEGNLVEKIESVLENYVNLKKIVFVNEPTHEDLLKQTNISKFVGLDMIFNESSIKINLQRILSQRCSIFNVYKIMEKMNEEYDCVVRFRTDCYPNKKILLSEYDLKNHIYIPSNMRHSNGIAPPFNDQFAIGNMHNMKIYCDAFNHFIRNLDEEPKTIQPETSLSYHLVKNKINVVTSDFNYYMINEEQGLGGHKIYKKSKLNYGVCE